MNSEFSSKLKPCEESFISRIIEIGHAVTMGDSYAYGFGVAIDKVEAVKWYRVAAKAGDADSQYKLGYCYSTGAGVVRDDNEAVKWYRLAADQGNVDAQCKLELC